ncbi:MAG: cobalt ABC transporter ATP-binding protein [Elusimicrobia bacterium RIFCSPLOWO2_01_FULL_59_12]|nr:MAG: cobalt ABC transporter ATP-binding protein [Elusimicrobia bacterium RIFCSPLOWO2_01_FULL_59_12]
MKSVLDVRRVSYRYPDGTRALENVAFNLLEGERLAVIGPNGAGKSTLFFHLNGTFQGEGEIDILGERLNGRTLAAARRHVGLVFQDPNDQLFMPTVFEDVAFGPVNLGYSETEVRERVQKALRQIGMEGSEALTPHHLSMGQRKKVALATVLAMAPRILAFDEPSSGLDPRSRRQLIELLKTLPQSQLIATHDLDLVLDVCHRAILLDGGRIVGEGKVPQIFDQEELLSAHGLEKPLRMQM